MSTRYKVAAGLLLTCVAGVLWLFYRSMPVSETDMRSSTCMVTGRVTLCLVSGRDTVHLWRDTVRQQGVWVSRHWWWPSSGGRVLTIQPSTRVSAAVTGDSLRRLVTAQADSLSRLLDRKDTEHKELAYYLRSHGVVDEGYTQIAAYAATQQRETAELTNTMQRLRTILSRDSAALTNGKATKMRLVAKAECDVSWYDASDSLRSTASRPMIYKPVEHHAARPVIIHTLRSTKPWGAYAVRNVPWGAPEHRKVVTVTIAPTAHATAATPLPHRALLVTGNYWRNRGHDLPPIFAADGAPVFTLHGRFIGIVRGKEVIQ